MHKRDLHQIHYQAWKKGLKSLYYCRSKSIQRPEAGQVAGDAVAETGGIPHLGKINGAERPNDESNGESSGAGPTDDDECLACQ